MLDDIMAILFNVGSVKVTFVGIKKNVCSIVCV